MNATASSSDKPQSGFVTQEQLVAFINDLLRRNAEYAGPERRSSERHVLITEVLVFPLDLALKPVGNSFLAVSRDLSTGGISFFHDLPTTPYLAVELEEPTEGRRIRAAVEVVRCDPIGPLFEIAGRFIYKIYKQDA